MCRQTTDAIARDHGTVGSVEPLTPEAAGWLYDNLPPDTPRLGRLLCVDDAGFLPLVEDMQDAGLVVDVHQAGSTF